MKTQSGSYSIPAIREQISERLAALIYASPVRIIDCDIRVGGNKPVFVGGNRKYARFLPITGYIQVPGRSFDLNLALELTHLNVRGQPLNASIRRLFLERIAPLLTAKRPAIPQN